MSWNAAQTFPKRMPVGAVEEVAPGGYGALDVALAEADVGEDDGAGATAVEAERGGRGARFLEAGQGSTCRSRAFSQLRSGRSSSSSTLTARDTWIGPDNKQGPSR